MSGTRTAAATAALALTISAGGTARAQDASILYGRTFNYIDSGRNCVSGGCLSFSEPGRAQVLRNGKILYFFGNGRGGYQPQGIALEINRTVDLGRGGRLPRGFRLGQLADVRGSAQLPIIRALSNLASRGGTGTVTFDGRQVRATLDLSFAGPIRDGGGLVGTGTAQVQIAYTFDTDGAGRLVGGSSTLRANGVVQSGGAPETVEITGTSTLSPL